MKRHLTLREFLLKYPTPYPPSQRAAHLRLEKGEIPCAEMDVTDGKEDEEEPLPPAA